MTEIHRYDDGTTLDNGADILLHGSELKPVAELPQDWLLATREAMTAASSTEKKPRPLTREEELSREVASYGGKVVPMRLATVAQASERLAA